MSESPRSTVQPSSAALLYLWQSSRNPAGDVCRPSLAVPPSISTASLRSGQAKSHAQLRPMLSANRCSRTHPVSRASPSCWANSSSRVRALERRRDRRRLFAMTRIGGRRTSRGRRRNRCSRGSSSAARAHQVRATPCGAPGRRMGCRKRQPPCPVLARAWRTRLAVVASPPRSSQKGVSSTS